MDIINLSIITINYNNAIGLKKTMESVFAQTLNEFEYIVVDGLSTDGSIDVIKRFNQLTNLSFNYISEPDSGIYNAMNKGIKMARGEYLLFINSGDYLTDNCVIENVLPYLNNDCDIVSGELNLIDNTKTIKLNPPENINLNYCIKYGLTHPNTFIRKILFDKYGLYNENNKIVSDWEFFLKVCGLNACKYIGIPVLVSNFMMDGISTKNEALMEKETKEVLKRLLPWWKKAELFIKRK